MTYPKSILTILIVFLISCSGKKDNKVINGNSKIDNQQVINLPEKVDLPDEVENSSFDKIINDLKLKKTPLIDTTNFNNFNKTNFFNKQDFSLLQLKKIYPQFYKEGYNYKAASSYKIDLSEYFHSIVITTYKGDNEMESTLINYDLDGKLIDFKIISYDEIAEGWYRKHSKIANNIITTIDELYADIKQVDTTKFHINKNGEINPIKVKFSSTIRPNGQIELNKIYTDTIEFTSFSDGGDYALLFGNKNEKEVRLIYDMWDWEKNEKYNFKYRDVIRITWEMDSVFIAGDGETLDFAERVIDAERIISNNKQVKFLWRAEKFDEELNQNINSIFINESFTITISNQEKAALGYVATFIGNECMYDGKANEKRDNLKCKILTALDLGYQCSNKHLSFLRSWFSKDSMALKALEICPTIPYTATVQTTFDEITLFTDKESKTITVRYKAHGVNNRESRNWSWTQTNNFKYDLENITLMDSKKSDVTLEDNEIKEKYSLALKTYLIQEWTLEKQNNTEIGAFNFEDNVLTIQGTNGFALSSYDFSDVAITKSESSEKLKLTVHNVGGGAGGNVIISETYILSENDSASYNIEKGKFELLN